MSRRETSAMFRDDERRRSAELVEHHRHDTKRHTHRANNFEQANTQRREQLSAFQNKHQAFNDAGFRQYVSYLIPVAAIPAALALDFLLFGGTAKYIAGIMFPDAPQMVWVVRVVVSIAVLTLEMFVAYMIVVARQRGETEDEAQTARWLWIMFGVILVAAIAAFTVVAHPAMVDDAGVAQSADRNMRLLGLLVIVTFSLVVHSSIVFGGRWIHEGIAFAGFLRVRRKRLRQIDRGDGDYERAAQSALRSFNNYYDERERHNRAHHEIPVGEFDATTCKIINDLSGYERIRFSNQSSGRDREPRNANDAAPSPSPTVLRPSSAPTVSAREAAPISPAYTGGNGNAPSGTEDYLRDILDRRRRNDDGELRPEDED